MAMRVPNYDKGYQTENLKRGAVTESVAAVTAPLMLLSQLGISQSEGPDTLFSRPHIAIM
jgi:hypothetical protein